MTPSRILLVATARSYRTDEFARIARALGEEIELWLATDRCHVLAGLWGEEPGPARAWSLPLDLRAPERAVEQIARLDQTLRATGGRGLDGIVGECDATAYVAALAAKRLALPHVSPEAARTASDKGRSREALQAAGVPVPRFERVLEGVDAVAVASRVGFPCVLKPLLLSMSRGVIRVDDAAGAAVAAARIRKLLRAQPPSDDPAARQLLCEAFVPGGEVAVEGLVRGGRFELLAIFDKPDPLDGPFFAETIYVTPSRLPEEAQRVVEETVARAAAALGLDEGPIHAELRIPTEPPRLARHDGGGRSDVSPSGAAGLSPGFPPVVLEVAARSIGGLCARTLRFGAGMPLEELLLRHAARLPIPPPRRERKAAGVLMLPVPRAGVLQAIRGLEAARAVPFVEDVAITARPGERLVPLPEGASYLGFVFSRAPAPDGVEAALREAGRCLDLDLDVGLPLTGEVNSPAPG